jgi:leucine-rich repeat protein SHOC2
MQLAELEQIIEIARRDRVTTLDLSNKDLISLPESIGTLTNLNYLNLERNQLTTLPETIGNLTNLTRLDLNNNQLSTLPSSIGSLINLNYLSVLGNQIISLPDSTTNLTSLIRFQIEVCNLAVLIVLKKTRCNDFSYIAFPDGYLVEFSEWQPQWLLEASSYKVRQTLVKHLNYEKICRELNANKVEIEREYTRLTMDSVEITYQFKPCNDFHYDRFFDYYDVMPVVFLRSTLPSDCYVSIFPMLLYTTQISLARNKLDSIPDQIGDLINLDVLSLTDNRLRSLPASIANLVNLRELCVGANKLTTIPESISQLTNLTTLNLFENQISSIPAHILNLINLKRLNLSGNPLTDLSILQKLPKLERVSFLWADLPRRYWIKFSDWDPLWLLDEENVEIKRVLINQVGYEKICQELNAITIDVWREYTLLKIDDLEQVYRYHHARRELDPTRVEPMVLLKMTCPSTQHIHILRVPPEVSSAEAAITWVNHGIHPDQLAIQT